MQPVKSSRPFAVAAFAVFIFIIIFFRLNAALSLLAGLMIGILLQNPFPKKTKVISRYLLQISIVLLGFGMNFNEVLHAGKEGFIYTLLTIAAAMGLGYVLGRLLKVDHIIAYLVSCGTAICGGSAIAAISQVLKTHERNLSVSIGTVFVLNGLALLIFPAIGNFFHMTQEQFGIWAAIAIHDTSSVAGASARYGNESMMIATTVKLARALWIVPLVMITSLLFRKKGSAWNLPWFILFFLVASLINTSFPLTPALTSTLMSLSKTGFSITLFLIGCDISLRDLKQVGLRPFMMGTVLWIIIVIVSLYTVITFI